MNLRPGLTWPGWMDVDGEARSREARPLQIRICSSQREGERGKREAYPTSTKLAGFAAAAKQSTASTGAFVVFRAWCSEAITTQVWSNRGPIMAEAPEMNILLPKKVASTEQ